MNTSELCNPYHLDEGGEWLRGNLHAHTTRSDGRCDPRDVVADYLSRGHDFLMISDHDCLAGDEELATWKDDALVLLPGNEISAGGSHILHVNGHRLVAPDPDRQRVFDAIAADTGSFSVVCHPNWLVSNGAPRSESISWFDHASMDNLLHWQGYVGLEIFNGVTHRLDGSAFALNKWDRLLAAGRRVWGFANDDSHRSSTAPGGDISCKPDLTPFMNCDVGLGWNVVWARRDRESIARALYDGCFYASTGVAIQSIEVRERRIQIRTSGAVRFVAIRETGRHFSTGHGTVWEVDVPADAIYARIECHGENGQAAWTQPFFPTKQA